VANGQGSCNGTAATCQDGGTNSSRRRRSDGQGIAGHTVSQSISNIVCPKDIAFRTQVAETANLVASSILEQNVKYDMESWWNFSVNWVKHVLHETCTSLESMVLSRNSPYQTTCHMLYGHQAITLSRETIVSRIMSRLPKI
jgi:hypothetical protein